MISISLFSVHFRTKASPNNLRFPLSCMSHFHSMHADLISSPFLTFCSPQLQFPCRVHSVALTIATTEVSATPVSPLIHSAGFPISYTYHFSFHCTLCHFRLCMFCFSSKFLLCMLVLEYNACTLHFWDIGKLPVMIWECPLYALVHPYPSWEGSLVSNQPKCTYSYTDFKSPAANPEPFSCQCPRRYLCVLHICLQPYNYATLPTQTLRKQWNRLLRADIRATVLCSCLIALHQWSEQWSACITKWISWPKVLDDKTSIE